MALNDPRKGYQRLIGQAALSLKAELEAAFLAAGYQLTAPQWALLHSLDQREGVSQNEIAPRVSKDKTNVARILAALEEDRFIRRSRDPLDRRSYQVYLTARGRRGVKTLEKAVLAVLQKALVGLPKSDLEITRRTLERIHVNLSGSQSGSKLIQAHNRHPESRNPAGGAVVQMTVPVPAAKRGANGRYGKLPC